MSRFTLLIWLCSILPLDAADPGFPVPLWAEGAPGSEGRAGDEQVLPRDKDHAYIRLSKTNNPSVLVYLPPKEKANGAAVVIAPGGGHSFLAMDVEGYEIVEWLNKQGIAGIILKYRLAREPGSPYKVLDHAFPDAQRALRLVRSRSGEWGIDPNRVGFMGFSAGGELAALAETRFDKGDPHAVDPINRMSSRPDFSLIVYPGFRLDQIASVPADSPPAFLVCSSDDKGHVVTTANLYLALQKAGVPVEMHLFEKGGHGFGMRDKQAPVTHWNARLLEWMDNHKFLSR